VRRQSGTRIGLVGPGRSCRRQEPRIFWAALDLMATFGLLCRVVLPPSTRGRTDHFDAMTCLPVLLGSGKCERKFMFYFTRTNSLQARPVNNYKAS